VDKGLQDHYSAALTYCSLMVDRYSARWLDSFVQQGRYNAE
jgi:hypothetical protein